MNDSKIQESQGTERPEDKGDSSGASKDVLRKRIQDVLDEEVNPGIAMHGGVVLLLDIGDQGQVYVQMGGGCHGCGMVDVTLRQGIETILRERVPEMGALIDTTDHAEGTNPYFMPSR
ncbi:MAG: NifU family protein [Planctomycetota bacterium]|nr:NifU family protein [Planctomycetota bacterium]